MFGRLREEIKKKYGTLGNFAVAMGMNQSTFSVKINGSVDFTRSEIAKAVELLDIDVSQIHEFFFYD